MSPAGNHVRDLLSGRRRGPLAVVLRAALLAFTPFYRLALLLRDLAYTIGIKRTGRPTVPVVSVGNITAGGTGKSPFVAWVVHLLSSRGIRAAVVSRGYGAVAGELGDEGKALLEAAPDVLRIEDPDRVRGCARAVAAGAQAVVLDDAFQHRACARDLDIVLVDATEPFGHGHLLPRGLLREPLGALRRADVIVLTRVDQAEPTTVDAIQERLADLAPGVSVARARHTPVNVAALDGGAAREPGDLKGRPVLALSGLGNPEAFERTLRDLGADVVATIRHPDHHPYRVGDLQAAETRAREAGASAIVTTTKDAVKLRELPAEAKGPAVLVLEVEIVVTEGVDRLVNEIMACVTPIRSND